MSGCLVIMHPTQDLVGFVFTSMVTGQPTCYHQTALSDVQLHSHTSSIPIIYTPTHLHTPPQTSPALSFPTNVEELRVLTGQLHSLKEQHFYRVVGLFSLAYLYKQTFAIPGSFFMVGRLPHILFEYFPLYQPTLPQNTYKLYQNVLAGALFGVWWGVPLVCVLTACGASCCYLLSWTFGSRLVYTYFSDQIVPLQQRVSYHGNYDISCV